jgi:hypothetical protein
MPFAWDVAMLRSVKPAALPVQQLTKFEFVINISWTRLSNSGLGMSFHRTSRFRRLRVRESQPFACCAAHPMPGLGQIQPPSYVAATAELASIADAGKAWRGPRAVGITPATGGRFPAPSRLTEIGIRKILQGNY